jgi:predicted anti-sigma-YlaC factor YlaD
MNVSPLPLNCERVRSQISLALDAEVSELDRRLVAAHLARCGECRAVESTMRAFTEELRTAPLEPPCRSITVTRPRTRRRALLRTTEYSVAATVLIAFFGVFTQLELSDSGRSTAPLTPANLFQTAWSPELELAQLDPAASAGRASTGGPGPIHAV